MWRGVIKWADGSMGTCWVFEGTTQDGSDLPVTYSLDTVEDLDASREVCQSQWQHANGAGFNDVERDLGFTAFEWEQEPAYAGMNVEQLAKTVVNADGDEQWLADWLEARGLTGDEEVISSRIRAKFDDQEDEIVECYTFAGVYDEETLNIKSWSNVVG